MKFIFFALTILATTSVFSQQSDVELKNKLLINSILEFKSQPYSSEINPFVTDLCTMSPQSIFPFTNVEGWAHCCIEHDIAHWAGGNEDLRDSADKRLKQCMKKINKPAAELFYQVVKRLGHPSKIMSHPLGRTSPWGYGWNYYIGHDDLTLEQEVSVCNKLQQWKTTDQHDDFVGTYMDLQEQEPIMPICD